MLNKLYQKISLRFIVAFAVTLFLGIVINSFTGNYWVEFTVTESFTKSEAESLVGKRVFDTCFDKNEKISGTIISHEVSDFDKTRVLVIKYDKPIAGKFNNIRNDKSVFNQCTGIVE